MDETREHVFARAGLAGDDDGRIEPGGCLRQFDDAAHHGALINDRGRFIFVGCRLTHDRAQAGVLFDEPAFLVGLENDGFHLIERRGLRQIIVSAESHGFDASRERCIGCEHDNFGRVFHRFNLAQRVEAGDAAHLNVEKNDIEVSLLERLQRLFAARKRGRFDLKLAELVNDQVSKDLVIVHHQHTNLTAHASFLLAPKNSPQRKI